MPICLKTKKIFDMTHEEILKEFKHRSEVLWKAAKNPKNEVNDSILMNGKARAYDEVIDFLESNAEWV